MMSIAVRVVDSIYSDSSEWQCTLHVSRICINAFREETVGLRSLTQLNRHRGIADSQPHDFLDKRLGSDCERLSLYPYCLCTIFYILVFALQVNKPCKLLILIMMLNVFQVSSHVNSSQDCDLNRFGGPIYTNSTTSKACLRAAASCIAL